MKKQAVLRLTPTRAAIINKLLEDITARWTIYGLHNALAAAGYRCAYSSVHNFFKVLHSTGYLVKQAARYRVSNAPGLVNLLSSQRPLGGKPARVYYHPAGLKARMDFFRKAGKEYAFTSFVAGNLYQQYVMTENIHAYVSPAEFDKQWKPLLRKNGFFPVESGARRNVFLILDEDSSTLALNEEAGGYMVAPKATIVADLLSVGGLGEELGLMLMEGFKWVQKPRKSQKGI